MRLFLTGGAGFIGSRVCSRLLDLGHRVLVCDNLSTGFRSNVDRRAEFCELAAEDPNLRDVIGDFKTEGILHIGGNSSGEVGELQPLNDIQWNVQSTLNLLTIAQQFKIKNFVYASSMGVYGQSDLADRLKEEHGSSPISIYGTGKKCSENYLSMFATRGINSIALRMFNVYGPGQNLANPRQGMISIYMEQLARTGKICVRGSLDRVRDFVFIDDVSEAWVKALERLATFKGHEVVNIGTGNGTSVRQILDSLQKIVGNFEVIEEAATPADQNKMVSDPNRAKLFMGWSSQVSVEEGLSQMWSWVKQQPISRSRS